MKPTHDLVVKVPVDGYFCAFFFFPVQVDVLYSFVCHKAGGHGLEEVQFN